MAARFGAVDHQRVDAGRLGLLRMLYRRDDVQPLCADRAEARQVLARPALRGDHDRDLLLERDLQKLGRPAFVSQLQGVWWTSGMEPRTEQKDALRALLGNVPIDACPLLLEQVLWDAVGKHPTTGAIAIAMAAHAFPGAELLVCGMGKAGGATGVGHYHQAAQQMWAGHDFEREEVLLEQWAQKGLFRRLD